MTIDFSLDSPEFQDDPIPVFAAMRSECPVHHNELPAPHFSLTREADVRAALRDDTTWSSKAGPGLAFADASRANAVLVNSDPPKHTTERIAISRLFKPSAIDAMGDDIRGLVEEIIDGFADRGEGDLIEDLAMAVPLTVMCWLLGTPVADISLYRSWVLPMAEGVTFVSGSMEPRVAKAYAEFGAYFSAHIAERRAVVAADVDVPEDLLTRLLTVERDGVRLNDAQVLGFCQFLMVAGSATTTLLIGNVVHRLLEHPDQLALVQADRSLVASAVEESCRFDSPVHGLFRTNTCPVSLHDVEIPEGSKTLMMFSSANRDPHAWSDPDRFDITRDLVTLRRNYAFGYGIHYCLGAPLARMEASAALEAVLDRLPDLALDGAPRQVRASVLHGWESLPVCWTPASVSGPARGSVSEPASGSATGSATGSGTVA
jgi:cytochrome P450